MTLASVVPPRSAPMKRFPPGDSGVLLPPGDRRTAALGVAMYTASSPRALRVQAAAWHLVRRLGARALPGRAESVSLPGGAELWEDLLAQWHEAIGPVEAVAVYRRRQAHRVGLTMTATRGGRPLAVLKVRDDVSGLEREQEALAALARSGPTTFGAPEPLGVGRAGSWAWSAQSAVFDRPHRPALEAPRALFDEVESALRDLLPALPAGEAAGHGDLTPWNLRRDHRGRLWLFDWEDWGAAPADADRAYFCACSRAVGGPPMPRDLAPAALDRYRPVLAERQRLAAPGVTLPTQILAALDEAAAAGREGR